MSRIAKTFLELRRDGRKAFIPYITAGDPDLETTGRLILEMENSGADIIELGVPFSDPMADGPVIQRASERALKNGVTIGDCLALIERVRRQSEVPVVVFSYLNPLLSLGLANIGSRLRDAGVDGVLATDLVPEEAGEFRATLQNNGIDTIFLAAPTSTDERMRMIGQCSSGFLYAVSRTGVTGVRKSLSESAAELVARLRRFTELPIALGFGISTADQVAEVWRHADGAVVGSRIVAEVERLAGSPHLVEAVGDLVRELARSGRTASQATD